MITFSVVDGLQAENGAEKLVFKSIEENEMEFKQSDEK